jgi:hypothetical protein
MDQTRAAVLQPLAGAPPVARRRRHALALIEVVIDGDVAADEDR